MQPGMWITVIKVRLNEKQCCPAVASWALVQGGRGLYAGVGA